MAPTLADVIEALVILDVVAIMVLVIIRICFRQHWNGGTK